MREDCRHFESRSYDDGEVARFCRLGLAPEAPWRCPDNCPSYERSVVDPSFTTGSMVRPAVEDEPDEEAGEDIAALLADAEVIVAESEPEALRDLEESRGRRWWQVWKRRPPDDGDDFRLSNR